jgi:hypothetical protein
MCKAMTMLLNKSSVDRRGTLSSHSSYRIPSPHSATKSMILLHNFLCKRSKVAPLIHLLPPVGLCKHRQRIPRHLAPDTWPRTPHKVGHRLELALGDDLERLTRLERKTVSRDGNLDYCPRPRMDVETRLRIRRALEFFERSDMAEVRPVRHPWSMCVAHQSSSSPLVSLLEASLAVSGLGK